MKWVEKSTSKIKDDISLIKEWRHVAVAHRGEIIHFASAEYEEKFKEARISEKEMHDLLLEFLCQIKLKTQGVPIKETADELKLRLVSFEPHIKKCMKEIYKD